MRYEPEVIAGKTRAGWAKHYGKSKTWIGDRFRQAEKLGLPKDEWPEYAKNHLAKISTQSKTNKTSGGDRSKSGKICRKHRSLIESWTLGKQLT